jgi:hypothetical protein
VLFSFYEWNHEHPKFSYILLFLLFTVAHSGNWTSSITSPSGVTPNSNLSELIKKSSSE